MKEFKQSIISSYKEEELGTPNTEKKNAQQNIERYFEY